MSHVPTCMPEITQAPVFWLIFQWFITNHAQSFSVQPRMALRPYQKKAADAGIEFLNSKAKGSMVKDNGVVVIPTGGGKSHIIAAIADAMTDRVVIIQPSKELLVQNFNKFYNNGGIASVYSASLNSKDVGHVTFATIGSIKNVGHLFKGCKLIIDECHKFPPESTSMLSKFLKDACVKKILGLTATPFRLKGDELKFITRMKPKLFGSIIHVMQVEEIIELGFWSKMMYKPVNFDDKMLVLNSAGTDYTEASMKKAWKFNNMEETILHTIGVMLNPPPDKWKARKSVLVFVPSVDEARSIADKLPHAVAVWGDMPTKARDLCINDFKAGKIPVVVNVDVLSVGFDHPGVDGIIVARPTLSLAWYYQAVGRGTRIEKSKADCWVYDLAGTFARFGRVEDLIIDDVNGYGWGVFGTSIARLFTGMPMSETKCFTIENCHLIDEYRQAIRNGWGWPPDPKKKYGQAGRIIDGVIYR